MYVEGRINDALNKISSGKVYKPRSGKINEN
jgi:hypothetical protein